MGLPVAMTAVESGTVLLIVGLIVFPIAAIAFARSGTAWESIGKGPFAIEDEFPAEPSPESAPAASRALQETEVRQMLEAKSYRRQRRGEAPLDVEAETQRLLSEAEPAAAEADEELRAEVRQLVIASNERRRRAGESALDVEDEVERRLRALSAGEPG